MHTKEEVAIFSQCDYLGDYILNSHGTGPCEEDSCASAGKCVCDNMGYWAGDNHQSLCLLSKHHDLGPCACDECREDYCSGPDERCSTTSSGDDGDPFMDTQYWAEGGWSDLYFNKDLWAMSAEEGTYGYDMFETDDKKTHRVPDLAYIGGGYVQTADKYGEDCYVHLHTCTSTYLAPPGYSSDDEERYRNSTAPSVIIN